MLPAAQIVTSMEAMELQVPLAARPFHSPCLRAEGAAVKLMSLPVLLPVVAAAPLREVVPTIREPLRLITKLLLLMEMEAPEEQGLELQVRPEGERVGLEL